MDKINHNMDEAVAQLEKRQAPQAASTSNFHDVYNNLALMLSDALSAMQQQSQSKAIHRNGKLQ